MARARVAALLVSMVVALAAEAADLPWYAHYDKALTLIDEGQGEVAREHLAAAVAARPEPGLAVRVYGTRFVDYLPYLYLAVACHQAGDEATARAWLAASEARGVAARSERGRELLAAYQILLAPDHPGQPESGPTAAAAADDTVASFRVYPERELVLAEVDARRIEDEVALRCGVSDDQPRSHRPWYFHYEVGLALAERGDPQRALDALVAAADRRPLAQRGARMYGMWFTDYLPYLAIARAHVELGNWSCALDALEVSRRMGEVGEDDDDFVDVGRLVDEARRQR